MTEDDLDHIDALLAATDALLAAEYPGPTGSRQPVHTVYLPADRFTATTSAEWGEQARSVAGEHGGVRQVCSLVGIDDALLDEVAHRTEHKLGSEPIEDLRIDFEDGYGNRGDEAEDDDARNAARELGNAIAAGSAPPFVGIRFKCFEKPTRARGLRTLTLFLETLLEAGPLPDGFRLTLPKVTTVAQVEAMVFACERLEAEHGLPAGRLRFEVQVETPQLIVDADGVLPVARMLHRAGGRVTGLHYGTYDYSASLGIAAAYQSMEHPAADYAKQVMQVAVAGTGVELSDGSTNIVPVGDAASVEAAWMLHARLVGRSLGRGYYQGWDLHPAQLPTRFIATYAFYREGLTQAGTRLRDYVSRTASGFMDEPATARALAGFIARALACGATSESEVRELTGLGPDELRVLAYPALTAR